MSHCDTCSCIPPVENPRPSTPSTVLAVADPSPIASLDGQIHQVRSSLIQLCRTRNALLPVSRLLPEILCEIFAIVRDCLAWAKPTVAWVKTTHVSYEWRAIALADLSLWSVVDLANPFLGAQIVRRSRNAPIMRVHLSQMSEWNDDSPGPAGTAELLALLSRPACRVGELDITASHGYLREILAALMPSSPSHLRVLRIATHDDYGSLHRLFEEDVELLHIEVFHADNCTWDWNRPPFHRMQNLRDLNIYYDEAEHGTSGSVDMPVLNNFPLLERLSLYNVSQSDGYLPSDFRLVLPRLSMLDLDTTYRTVCWFIRHLDIPETCRMVINYDGVWNSFETDRQVLLESVGLVMHSNSPSSLATAASIQTMNLHMEIFASCSTSPYPALQHRLMFGDRSRDSPSETAFIHQHEIATHVLPLARSKLMLEYSGIDEMHRNSAQYWIQALATVQASTIHIKTWELSVIVEVLSAGASDHVPLPNMKTLIMENIITTDPDNSALGAEREAEFFLALKRRADGGTLEKIVLLHCDELGPSLLDRWRASVPNVLVVEDGSIWVDE